jgi:hypothetical protein
MERRFGHNFSKVMVHPGAEAGQSAREIKASAYTVGEDIVFGAGQFAPGTYEGRRLIAHELTHVVQQEKGSVGLQRQPQDIDTILNEAKGTVEELEEIRKQLREGAENLEILRGQLILKDKKLPRASTKIADRDIKSNAALFAEGLIETSKILQPYLTGKIASTSVAKNFKIYDFRSEFETKHEKLERIVSPSIGKAKPEKQIYGFFHRKSDSIHLAPDATFGHVLHEAIHKYSAIAIQNALGIFFNEGVTQYFTDLVAAEHTLGSTSHIYGPNLKCANTVLGWINNDRATFARAYFQGDGNPLLLKVMQNLGIKTAKELIRLRTERGGSGLCEDIEEKGH